MVLSILQETPDYVVCIKPRGVESQQQMLSLLCAQFQGDSFYAVHRLDKETGGVMVYARTKQAAAWLSKEIQEHRFHKTYFALVYGCPTQVMGCWEDLLYRDGAKNKSYVVKRKRKGVKQASLTYETAAQGQLNGRRVSLLCITLHTGRTHQIRVQAASRGFPLVGDAKYGGGKGQGMGLWCHCLTFTDPAGKTVTYKAALPDAWPFHNWEKEQIG